MDTFLHCQMYESEFGSSTSCAVRLDHDGKIEDFVDSSTRETNYVWDINFPCRDELIGKSFDAVEELFDDACTMEEGSYRSPYWGTDEISKEDFMMYKFDSLVKDIEWFKNGNNLSKYFLKEYKQAIPELKEFYDEKTLGNLEKIVTGLKVRDEMWKVKKAKSLKEKGTEDKLEEKAEIITFGDRSYRTRGTSREEHKKLVAENHYKNLRKYYGKDLDK